ncbi:MAG: tRNA (N(6)-L-threonylcarbamoyladenosine(37)-C(2))-methylthiotransferase MtaB [Clostridia bacterium]|nr:tRNA (N(6)-L-threonylcarbamoyladenosine(37)-C(2))-methylthiotransferase MtaB [Clostridia bacterium]
MTASICNLGCKVNYYESEFYAQELAKLGVKVVPFPENADIYIINSCTVTAESDRKGLQMIRRASAKNPNAFIVVTGCLAQMDPQRVSTIPGVDCIIGNTNKLEVLRRITAYINGEIGKSESVYIQAPSFPPAPCYEPMELLSTHHARATVKIEDGCNSHCAYCIISTARGPARSKAPDDVLREVRNLAAVGYKEVILTGIELASYEGDLPFLVKEMGNIPGIERIRLGSLDPAYLTPARIDKLREATKLAPHFHISLQSGCTATLNRMRRKYNREMALKNLRHLREAFPEAQFFADIIVGFPGETEEDFLETVDFIQQIRFLHLHIFPYSKRAGTEAATMEHQVSKEIKSQRGRTLAAVQQAIKREILENVVKNGTPLPVLFETEENGVAIGHTHHFMEIEVQGLSDVRGKILSILPVSTNGDRLFGVLAVNK